MPIYLELLKTSKTHIIKLLLVRIKFIILFHFYKIRKS
jgi:hypothetical protein